MFKKIILLLTLLTLLLLAGCVTKIDAEEYQFQINSQIEWGKKECLKHGQTYLMIHTYDLEKYPVVCYQESPMRFFEYVKK